MHNLESLTLDLSRNAIGDDAFLGLSEARVCSRALRHLALAHGKERGPFRVPNLADNDLGSAGVLALARFLALSSDNLENLQSVALDVTNNVIEQPEGVVRLLMAFRQVKRMELNASSNRIGNFTSDDWASTAWETLVLDLTSNGLTGTTEFGRFLAVTCARQLQDLTLWLGYNRVDVTRLLGQLPELRRLSLDLNGGFLSVPRSTASIHV